MISIDARWTRLLAARTIKEKNAAAASAAGPSGMDAALARLGAAFDGAAAINQFKLGIEQALRLGPQHPAVRARFRARAAAAPDGALDDAIAAIERWWHEEKKAFPLASALGYGNRLPLETLRELRLILRLIRFKGMAGQFGALTAALCDDATALAAE